jgi:hypothetical protein
MTNSPKIPFFIVDLFDFGRKIIYFLPIMGVLIGWQYCLFGAYK